MGRYIRKDPIYKISEKPSTYTRPIPHYGQIQSRSPAWHDADSTGHAEHLSGSQQRREKESSMFYKPRTETTRVEELVEKRGGRTVEDIHRMLENLDDEDRSFLELLIENEENPFSEPNTHKADPAEDRTEPATDEALPESLQNTEALSKEKNETIPTINEIFPKETLPNEITGQNTSVPDLINETSIEQTNPFEMKKPFEDAKEIFQQIEPYETASEQTPQIELEPLEPQEDEDPEEDEPY